MAGRWTPRLTAAAVAIALVATGCSGDDGDDGDDSSVSSGASTSVAGPPPQPVTGFTAQATESSIELTWSPVEGASAYRVGTDEMAVDVPTAVCADQCRVSVAAERVPEGTVSLQSVAEDGSASEPADATVSGTPQTRAAEPTPPDELVLVVQGSPPTIKRVPFDSAEEAERLLEKNLQDPALADAGVSLPAQLLNGPFRAAGTTVATPSADGVSGTWQQDYLQFDRLPGEPRGHDVVVAVIDNGVDAEHPSVAGAVLDGTHVVDDGASGTSSPGSHGTAVASLIVGQEGGAVPGIAPGARILPIDVTDEDQSEGGTIPEGIVWAVDHGADIINISMGSTCRSFGPLEACPEDYDAAVNYAESQGVFVVAGAGNNGDGAPKCDDPANEKVWPAVVGPVISVGGHTEVGQTWECSPDRPDVEILLPSTDLLVAQQGSTYEIGEGTSYAAPLMSGLLAVVLAERPDLTPAQVRAMLPQWQSANQTVNVTAVLCLLEFIDCEGPSIDLPDVAWYYPYRATFTFSGDHPVNAAMPLVETHGLATSSESWSPTSIHQGSADFGELTGAIYGMKDGTVQATGVMTYSTASSWFNSSMSLDGDALYDIGPIHGHQLLCPWSLPEGPQPATVFGWQVPAVVEAELVSEEGAPEPQVRLSFSLGVGATPGRAGELPPISYPYATVDRCAAAFASAGEGLSDPFDGTNFTAFAQVPDQHRTYLQRMEQITEDFVASSPMHLTDPITIRSTQTGTFTMGSGITEDPRIGVTIEHTPGGTWSSEDGLR